MSNKDWDFAADTAIEFIQKKADGNSQLADIWRVYEEALSKNRWANREFDSLIDVILRSERALEHEFAKERDRFEDWFPVAVEEMVIGSFATACLQDRDLERELPADIYRQMRKDADFFEDMTRGRGTRQNRGGRDDRDDRDRGRDRGGRSGGGLGNLPEGGRGGRDERSNARDYSTRSAGGGGRTETDSRWAGIVSATERADPEPVAEAEYEPARPDVEYVRDVRPQRIAPKVKPDTVINGPDHTKARPYDDFWLDGRHYQPAHLSKWQRTSDSDNADERLLETTPSFTDINEFIPFLVMHENGTVVEELLKMTEDLRYLQEELQNDPSRAKSVQTERPVRTAAISFASIGKKNESGNVAVEDAASLSPNAPKSLATVLREVDLSQDTLIENVVVDSLDAAVFAARVKREKLGEDKPSVDWYIVRTPVLIKDIAQHDLVDEIYNCNNLTEASEILRTRREEFEPGVWENLNSHFGQALLRSLKYQFQFPALKSLNFADHYKQAVEYFASKRDNAEAAQMAARVRFIIPLVCQNAGRNAEDVANLVDDLSGPLPTCPIVFTQCAATVVVNHTLDALGIGAVLRNVKENGVAVQSVKNEDLFHNVHRIYERMEKEAPSPAKVRVYIVTSDNFRVEVLPFAGRKEAYILALA